MGRSVIKIQHEGKDYYLEWSSIVDAPVTYGMELEEFEEYMRDEYGRRYMEIDHPFRMQRVRENGTSSRYHESMKDVVGWNRAGPNESQLTFEGIIYKYITHRERDHADKITKQELAPFIVKQTHILEGGYPMCGFTKSHPDHWDYVFNDWVSQNDAEKSNCNLCREEYETSTTHR